MASILTNSRSDHSIQNQYINSSKIVIMNFREKLRKLSFRVLQQNSDYKRCLRKALNLANLFELFRLHNYLFKIRNPESVGVKFLKLKD